MLTNIRLWWFAVAGFTSAFAGGRAWAQAPGAPQRASDSLVVEYGGRRMVLHPADLAALPRERVRGTLHGGPEHEFSGPSLAAVLTRAGVTLGGRGRALAQYLVAVAADSYRTVLSAGELDSTLTGRVPLVVDRQDGQPLPASDGPWRLVVPGDRRPARWVRQLVRLQMESAAP
jgi:hypothetical protein